MKPIRSSLPSSNWLVATVVPWLTAVIASPSRSMRDSTLRTPFRKPSAGSAGVDGVFVVVLAPVSSSTATTSVNVPPVSMPMRTRRSLMPGTLAMRYLTGKAAGSRFGTADAGGVEDRQDGTGRPGHVEPPRVQDLPGGQRHRRPHRQVHRDHAGPDDREHAHRGAAVGVGEDAAALDRRRRWGLRQVGRDALQLTARLGGPERLHPDVELV